MTKSELRTQYKAKRNALTDGDMAALSQQIADRFFADDRIRTYLDVPNAVLHTYLPIRRQNEVDTWPIIQRVWAEYPHVRVLSSVSDPTTNTLTSFELTAGTLLAENRWGIPEPSGPIEPNRYVPTLVVVPLLAFDARGQRIGYGGGYYDRFLGTLPANCLNVGLSLFPPTCESWPVEITDIPLDNCLTPAQTYWFA